MNYREASNVCWANNFSLRKDYIGVGLCLGEVLLNASSPSFSFLCQWLGIHDLFMLLCIICQAYVYFNASITVTTTQESITTGTPRCPLQEHFRQAWMDMREMISESMVGVHACTFFCYGEFSKVKSEKGIRAERWWGWGKYFVTWKPFDFCCQSVAVWRVQFWNHKSGWNSENSAWSRSWFLG